MALVERYRGKYLCLVDDDGWEWVTRVNTTGVVVIAAATADNKVLLVEQFRRPVGCPVIELPAGLAGDIQGEEDEAMVQAAKRELVEETGFEASDWQLVNQGPASAGQSTEVVSFFVAKGLRQVGEGGGDESEDIVVHQVPRDQVMSFLAQAESQGKLVDPKVFAGLFFLDGGK